MNEHYDYLLNLIREKVADYEFSEHDLVEIIYNSDMTHQHYLLTVLYNFYFQVEPQGLATRWGLDTICKLHEYISKELDSDLNNGGIDEIDPNKSYGDYLDSGVRFSNEFGEPGIEEFKSECKRRRNLRWRAA